MAHREELVTGRNVSRVSRAAQAVAQAVKTSETEGRDEAA
jgi:hypothetical protein